MSEKGTKIQNRSSSGSIVEQEACTNRKQEANISEYYQNHGN